MISGGGLCGQDVEKKISTVCGVSIDMSRLVGLRSPSSECAEEVLAGVYTDVGWDVG